MENRNQMEEVQVSKAKTTRSVIGSTNQNILNFLRNAPLTKRMQFVSWWMWQVRTVM